MLLHPAVGAPSSTGWTPPPERFLFGGAEPSAGGFLHDRWWVLTLVGSPPFGRRVVLTPVRTPDPVIADAGWNYTGFYEHGCSRNPPMNA